MYNLIIIGTISFITLFIAILMVRLRRPISFNRFKRDNQKITKLIGLVDTNAEHNYVLKQLYVQYLDHYNSFTQNKFNLVQTFIKLIKTKDSGVFAFPHESLRKPKERLKIRFQFHPMIAFGFALEKDEKAFHIIIFCATIMFYK